MSIVSEFKKFALRGSVVDMAIGFTVGAAFTTVAKSIVGDIIMPPIGLLTGQADFADLFVLLRPGTETAPPYATLADAQAAGAVTMNYGEFINTVIAFLLVAVVMFLVIKAVNRVDQELEERSAGDAPAPEEPDDKKCPHCRSTIPYKASRCPNCTSDLEPPAA